LTAAAGRSNSEDLSRGSKEKSHPRKDDRVQGGLRFIAQATPDIEQRDVFVGESGHGAREKRRPQRRPKEVN